tara:strand:+ start:675 stop:797 length:123 start_codon:yes stop_codon:yes gene_type:complete
VSFNPTEATVVMEVLVGMVHRVRAPVAQVEAVEEQLVLAV